MVNLYSETTVIAVVTVLTTVGIALTGLRFWVRLSSSFAKPAAALGPDDWLVALAAVFVSACAAFVIYGAVDGAAGNATTGASARARIEHRADFALVVVEKIAFGAVKLSLLFFFRRIFGVWASFRRINDVLIAFVGLWALAYFLAAVFICGKRPDLFWADDQQLARAHCANEGA